ncbi:MAG: transporter substrate-binding domain-containing protein [Oscillospiraceae bacterium]|nr:transporter substrate-binding domain-containing protein [Oscillospiraceae bacterium]
MPAIIASVVSACGGSAGTKPGGMTYYTQIPGITEAEIAEIEALKESRAGKGFSYGHILTTEAFVSPDGTYAGFTYRFCELLTELFGIGFIPEYHESWSDLKTSFDSFAVDFIGDLSVTPERLELYSMSLAIAERSLLVFTMPDSGIKSESDVNGLKIAFMKGSVSDAAIKRIYAASYETVEVDDEGDALEMLIGGEVDAFIEESVLEAFFEEYGVVSKKLFPLVYSPVSMSAANGELEPIINALNKYIEAGGIDLLYEIYNAGDREYVKYKLNKTFSGEERAYIARFGEEPRRKIAFAAEADNYPVSFYNGNTGKFEGIAIDILREIEDMTGLEFEIVTGRDDEWNDIYERLLSGEISMVSELVYSEKRADDFIWPDIPNVTSRYALLSEFDYPEVTPRQIVRAKVGVMKDSIYESKYREWFYDSDNLTVYPTQFEALAALEKGEIDLLMASELTLYTQTNYLEKPDYKVNYVFSTECRSMYGFGKNETELRSIVNKTLACLNTENIVKNWTARVFDYSTKLANIRADYLMTFSVILFATLIAVVIMFINSRRLSKNLARQTNEARIASKAKGEFLARMSHEIRTPLNAIIGMSEVAKKSVSDNAKALSSVNRIIFSSRHLLGIINDILDMSKIESGKLEITREPFSVMEAYNEVYGIISQRCLEKNIKFTCDINGRDDMTVVGDKLRVNQVLINLLGNAVKFTEQGGEVVLSIKIFGESDGEINARFEISDNGIGMTEEQRRRLFQPFEQADATIASRFGGTGLGLSISQNLIKMMGGEIKVESAPGKGTKFYFELMFPKGRAEESVREQNGNADFSGSRILLAEDIEINRFIIKELLSETGMVIDEAENGEKAVEMFGKSANGYYNLILMDIQMPVMDGYEAVREIRKLKRGDAASVPIVAMTANAYNEDVRRAIEAGMNSHLAKPIDIDAVMKTLKKFL